MYWRDLAPKFGFADTKEPPTPIMAALDQPEGLGFITIEVDEGTVYRITTAGINEVEDSLPAGDRLPDFVSGSSPKSVSLPFIDSTPDEFSSASPVGEAPVEIQDSLDRFRRDHPNPDKVAFIMMQFGQTRAHAEITEAVRDGLAAYGIAAVRADGKRYHDYLFYNVLTYLHGCGLRIAIYERVETQTYNPNVALEVGYLFPCVGPYVCLKTRRSRRSPQTWSGSCTILSIPKILLERSRQSCRNGYQTRVWPRPPFYPSANSTIGSSPSVAEKPITSHLVPLCPWV